MDVGSRHREHAHVNVFRYRSSGCCASMPANSYVLLLALTESPSRLANGSSTAWHCPGPACSPGLTISKSRPGAGA